MNQVRRAGTGDRQSFGGALHTARSAQTAAVVNQRD